LLTLSTDSLIRKLVILVIIVHHQKVWALTDHLLYKITLDKIVPVTPTICSDHFLWCYTHPPALFESPWDKFTILSCISTLGLKPLGGYSRQNGVSTLGASKTGKVHLVWWQLPWLQKLWARLDAKVIWGHVIDLCRDCVLIVIRLKMIGSMIGLSISSMCKGCSLILIGWC
jgi:hypothetical protein